CPSGQCCSKYGYCGTSEKHCGTGCQSSYGKCDTSDSISTNGRCGSSDGICPDGQCCSKYGYYGHCPSGLCCSKYNYCGTSEKYCDVGCQPLYGIC
ncbi:hypothetical protein BCR32DRAFT_177909, partial [Anaeromyces robustus]